MRLLAILLLILISGCAEHPEVREIRDWLKSSVLLTEHPEMFESEYSGFGNVRRVALLGDDYRKGFAMWVSPMFSFNVDLPEGGVIRFAYGVGNNVFEEGVETALSVGITEEDSDTLIGQWNLDLGDREQLGKWFDVEIPITSEIAGARKLSFSHTVTGNNERTGLFIAHPTIVQPDDGGQRKRVIWISLDSLRADHLGCFGYERETSPNIDTFAEDSTLFEYCISSSTWTFPSYASMLTGRYPSICGATTSIRLLPETEKTLSEIIASGDVATFAVVTSTFAGAGVGLQRGFDRQVYSREMYAEGTFGIVTDWLEKHSDEDCFVFVQLTDIQLPYIPKEEFARRFDPDYAGPYKEGVRNFDEIRLGDVSLTDDAKQHVIALYDEGILGCDADLGNFFEFLNANDMFDDSLIVINSDHGEEFWDHGGFEHGATHYDEILRVPMILKGPGFGKGERVKQLVGNVDVFPTIIQWYGLDIPKNINGVSLYETMNGHVETGSRRIVSEQNYFGTEQKSVTSDAYRYILHTLDGSEELFDLKADPLMNENIAQSSSEVSDGFRYLLTEYILNENDGWHVRIFRTNADIEKKGELFEGAITAPSGFSYFKKTKLSGADILEIDGNTISFKITMMPWTNMAFDFKTAKETDVVIFRNLTDGDPDAEQLVFLGPEREPADDVEFGLSIIDPIFGLGIPQFGPQGSMHHGLYIWGNPESLREEIRPELDAGNLQELKILENLGG